MRLRIDFAGLMLFVVRDSGGVAGVPYILAVDSRGKGGHVTHLLVDAHTNAVLKHNDGTEDPTLADLRGVEVDLSVLAGGAAIPRSPSGLVDFKEFVKPGHKKLPAGFLDPDEKSERIGTRFKVAGGAFAPSNRQCLKWNGGKTKDQYAAMVMTWEIDLGTATEAALPLRKLRGTATEEGRLTLTPKQAGGDIAISMCHTLYNERPPSIAEIHKAPTKPFHSHHLEYYDLLWPSGAAHCDLTPCDPEDEHGHELLAKKLDTYPRICPMVMIEG